MPKADVNLSELRTRLHRRGAAAADPGRAWPGALRWFAAQFLVVVAGVLVALALNAWWHERQDRAREVVYLKQLSADLAATEAELAAAQERFIEAAVASARVTQAFWQPAPPPVDSLLQPLWQPLASRRYRPVLGTIQALVATGDLRLIRSDALRSELLAYLEFALAAIEDIQRHDETYYRPGVHALREALDPSLLGHLRELAGSPGMPQHELRAIPDGERRPPFPHALDGLYANAVVYNAYGSLLTAHRNQAFNYRRILERARLVHGMVHQQLHGATDPGNCQLVAAGEEYVGSCGAPIAGRGELYLRLRRAPEVSTGAWARGWEPFQAWSGTARVPGGDETPIEVEVDIAGGGIVRSAFGWFPVRTLLVGEMRGVLSFRVDGRAEVEPNGLDAEILARARELLASERSWNRADDRRCTAGDTTFSLYCALHRASLEMAAGFHHRRPALQRVRALVEERSAGRGYAHRLQDYNNDPTTSLADLHDLIDQALAGLPAGATTAQRR